VLDHLFRPALVDFDVIPPQARGADLIHAEIVRRLETADLVLCDLSALNANVFFELGIRTALDKPVCLVKDEHVKAIPFDSGGINCHTYASSLTPWELPEQIEALANHVRDSWERAKGQNPLWRYFGLTKQGTPAEVADPVQAKLDLLLANLEGITQRELSASRSANERLIPPRGGLDIGLGRTASDLLDDFLQRVHDMGKEHAVVDLQASDLPYVVVLAWPTGGVERSEWDRVAELGRRYGIQAATSSHIYDPL
jgi:hypothetical protein